MLKRSAIIQCVIISTFLLFSSAVLAGQVSDQLKGTLIKLMDVLNDPAFKSPDKLGERNHMLHLILKERFDQEALARGALGSHWIKIKPEERSEFIDVFSSVLEETYFGEIDAQLQKTGNISIDNIHFNKELVKGDMAQVETNIVPGDGSEIPVIYRLKKHDGNWMVVDMAIEGVIITKNYRSQFNEILAKEPFSQLIDRLKAKQTK